MQLYLPGINPIYWKGISALPDSVYNKENNQTSSALTEQLLVAFIDAPAGTLVNIVVSSPQSGTFQISAKVVDDIGLVYTRIEFPYTNSQDDIEITIFDAATNIALEKSTFATSHMGFMYEIQSQILHQTLETIQQLSENITIEGVEDGLLEFRYGKFTGLDIRPEQTINEYRAQTSCLWKAYQYASMEKGLVDAIGCVLGAVTIVIRRTRDDPRATIFDQAQFMDQFDVFGAPVPDDYVPSVTPWPVAVVLVRDDLDDPHYYAAAIEDGYLLSTNPQDEVINSGADNTPGAVWDETVAQSFVILTEEAISNEIQVIIGSSEEDASSSIPQETVLRCPDDVVSGPLPDQLNNINVLPFVIVTQATIGGNPTPPAMPVENVDFTVDRFTGRITWTNPALTPDASTQYLVTYKYRLDEPLKIVIKKVKPAYRSVILTFSNVLSGLPLAIEV